MKTTLPTNCQVLAQALHLRGKEQFAYYLTPEQERVLSAERTQRSYERDEVLAELATFGVVTGGE